MPPASVRGGAAGEAEVSADVYTELDRSRIEQIRARHTEDAGCLARAAQRRLRALRAAFPSLPPDGPWPVPGGYTPWRR